MSGNLFCAPTVAVSISRSASQSESEECDPGPLSSCLAPEGHRRRADSSTARQVRTSCGNTGTQSDSKDLHQRRNLRAIYSIQIMPSAIPACTKFDSLECVIFHTLREYAFFSVGKCWLSPSVSVIKRLSRRVRVPVIGPPWHAASKNIAITGHQFFNFAP